jgi:hypothetical protein
MPPPHFIDTTRILIEIGFSLLIILSCLLIYFNTKEMYKITKHKGINFFRNTFLFFALAYFFRFLFLAIVLSKIGSFPWQLRSLHQPFLVFTSFFSSLAIISLTLSLIWKNMEDKYLEYTMYFIAFLIAIFLLISKSSHNLLIFQLLLFIFAVSLCLLNQRNSKKNNANILFIYSLIFMFWLLSLFSTTILRISNLYNFTLLSLSTILFLIIFYKVKKWTK